MKNTIKISTLGVILTILLFGCKKDEIRVRYDASMPIFKKAEVLEKSIAYGDSIQLNVSLFDPNTPLSTLTVKVVVNDNVLASDVIRTKGKEADFSKKYAIPFIQRMPDNGEVEVHLSSINVEGTKKDTIIVSTTAKRPEIPTMWLVTATKSYEIPLVDAKNHIYSAKKLPLDNDIRFRLATKINRFKKIDWSDPKNIVLGWVDKQLWFIDDSGDWITLSDKSILGFSEITVDLFNFTIKGTGEKLTPATEMNVAEFTPIELSSTNHLGVTTKEEWKTAQIYLGKETVMTINGVADLKNGLTPTFFEIVSNKSAKFLGETGVYKIYYLPSIDYIFVEQPDAVYPDALWLCGVGFGPVRTPYIKTSAWNWNSPLAYKYCRKTAPGVFETIIYAEHTADETFKEPWRLMFSTKFFHKRGWGGKEEDARTYTMPNNLLYAPTTADIGNFVGTEEFNGAPGVFRFTIDTNKKTTTFQRIK